MKIKEKLKSIRMEDWVGIVLCALFIYSVLLAGDVWLNLFHTCGMAVTASIVIFIEKTICVDKKTEKNARLLYVICIILIFGLIPYLQMESNGAVFFFIIFLGLIELDSTFYLQDDLKMYQNILLSFLEMIIFLSIFYFLKEDSFQVVSTTTYMSCMFFCKLVQAYRLYVHRNNRNVSISLTNLISFSLFGIIGCRMLFPQLNWTIDTWNLFWEDSLIFHVGIFILECILIFLFYKTSIRMKDNVKNIHFKAIYIFSFLYLIVRLVLYVISGFMNNGMYVGPLYFDTQFAFSDVLFTGFLIVSLLDKETKWEKGKRLLNEWSKSEADYDDVWLDGQSLIAQSYLEAEQYCLAYPLYPEMLEYVWQTIQEGKKDKKRHYMLCKLLSAYSQCVADMDVCKELITHLEKYCEQYKEELPEEYSLLLIEAENEFYTTYQEVESRQEELNHAMAVIEKEKQHLREVNPMKYE